MRESPSLSEPPADSVTVRPGRKTAAVVEAYLKAFHLASSLDYVASGAYRKQPSFQRFIQARAEKIRAATTDLQRASHAMAEALYKSPAASPQSGGDVKDGEVVDAA